LGAGIEEIDEVIIAPGVGIAGVARAFFDGGAADTAAGTTNGDGLEVADETLCVLWVEGGRVRCWILEAEGCVCGRYQVGRCLG